MVGFGLRSALLVVVTFVLVTGLGLWVGQYCVHVGFAGLVTGHGSGFGSWVGSVVCSFALGLFVLLGFLIFLVGFILGYCLSQDL